MRRFAFLVVSLALGCGDEADTQSSDSSSAGSPASGGGGSTESGTSSGGAGGGVGAGPTCGDGVVDGDEACDDAGASASCDDDCTAVSCGDGTFNAEAGEACDDGNTADGDTCSAGCVPTAFTLDPAFSASGSDDLAIAATAGGFATVWTRNGAGTSTLRYATFGVAGSSAPIDVVSGGALIGTIGSNADGRGLVLYQTYAASTSTLGWRVVTPDGTLGPEAGSETGADFWPAGSPVGKPWPNAEGRLCTMAESGAVRCTDTADGLLAGVDVTAPGVESAHLLALSGSLVASYVTSSVDPYELRVLALDANGQPQSPELPLSQFPPNANGHATGAVAKPDGTFAVLLTVGADVWWYPFHADGMLDATNVATIAQGGRAKVVGAPSGRFLLAWYTLTPSAAGDTCPILGRVFGPDATPDGEPFTIYQPPDGTCAARYDIAVGSTGDVALAWLEYHGSSYTAKAILLPGVLET